MADQALVQTITAEAQDRTEKIDAAWGTVIGAALYVSVGLGPMVLYTFGAFIQPILQDTGWTREVVAAAIGPATLLSGAAQPVAGILTDRFGVRRVTLVAAPLFAIALAAVGFIPQDPKTFAALLALLFVVGAATTATPLVQAITGWFDRRRGIALGVVLAGTSLGIALLPPIGAALIAAWGWRMAYVGLSVLALAVMLPSAFLLLKNPPRAQHKTNDGRSEGLTVKQALRTGRFWVLFVSFATMTAAITGVAVNFPVILSIRGVAAQQAAFIMTVVGLSTFVGRIFMGVLLDRFFSPWATATTWLAPFVGYLLLMQSDTGAGAIVAAALFGLGLGCEVDALAYIISRAFGLRHMGAVFGVAFIAYGIGAALGPALFGVLLQRGGNIDQYFLVAAGAIGVAALLLASLRPKHLPFSTLSPARKAS